jgi:hypothetical protein
MNERADVANPALFETLAREVGREDGRTDGEEGEERKEGRGRRGRTDG